jgi:hypothetical protein
MTTVVMLFAHHTAWYLWILPIVRADPLPKGSGGGGLKRIIKIVKLLEL